MKYFLVFKHGAIFDIWGQFGLLQNFGVAILDTCSFKVTGLEAWNFADNTLRI